ncbi:glutathione S-transferase LANCL1 isoform X2 [Parasteatoda tepidariorum]|nr:glutathione S-transferase LANCL1 isoform X2 [Parasteatoda tepidariorum]XP_015905853.1 glutathione S-transferase LANCL1 isoform X2 [Parasteatoda tepidariorum]XP_015905854.1 glutathione S-transferase LANCL1 isoform X2 [Parasteatoda tepidariorum]XP_042900900.1 glutathione S-transferase LANCL1 isoform X2 [Parasteatoda tepidariorum]XP_042900901.1 glutathione S-transferase LANCL1 isoform X2 [Parasteatoda tepidariorum]XP_042900902.1 glutathione S-transferase LANCL1 isoform X2 [Parasteatoda tepidar
MSDREFKNPFQDYDESLEVFDFETNRLIDQIEGPLKENVFVLLQTLEKHLAAESTTSDTSVYTGTSGIALLYMRFMDIKLCSGKKDFLKDALSYVEPYITFLRKRDVTFLCGVSGPMAIASALFHRKGMTRESMDLARRLENLEREACASECPDELLYGRVGFLYSLLFLNKHLGADEFRDNIIKEVIKTIFESGQRLAKKFSNTDKAPLFYEWHGSPYVGAAHGFAGILYMLLQAKEYLTSEQITDLVKPSIDWILSLQYPSGNFPSSLGSKTDKLIHWCHGAPGVVHLLLLAYETFHEEKYLEASKQCSDVVWKRGLLRKGYGICHGVAGNGYTHLRLFQVTKDVKYLWRAVKFAEWCFDYGKHGCRTPDRPLSLFEGFAGTIYYLLDLLEPLNAAFPAFQLF